VVFLIVGLWLVRLVLPSQLDDVSPGISCEEKLLNRADIYFVIPKFENIEIEREWCEDILKKEKTIGMHGVYHSYKEFEVYRNEEYFNEGTKAFEECFGFAPEKFKPGHLKWTDENNWIKEKMKVDLFWNQVFHKVYHCGDTGVFPNWAIRIF